MDPAFLPGCANWPYSCLSIMSPWRLFSSPSFLCMQDNPSVLIHWSDAHLSFLTGHEIQYRLCYCVPFDITSLILYSIILYVATNVKGNRKYNEEMLHSDLLLIWPSLIHLSLCGCRIGSILAYGQYFQTHTDQNCKAPYNELTSETDWWKSFIFPVMYELIIIIFGKTIKTKSAPTWTMNCVLHM